MKLYDGGRAPNPRRVRIFLAEKGISVPVVAVDMAASGHKQGDMLSRNPLGELPVLELDDGTVITESIAICRYFEALHPEPALFGRSAKEIAEIEMWQRRIELKLLNAIGHVFRHTHPGMAAAEVPQIAAWGEVNRPRVLDFLALLDARLHDRVFVCGDTISVADITGMIAIDFTKPAKITVPEELADLHRWHQAMKARPSATA
jgi:glutathione S-transferase